MTALSCLAYCNGALNLIDSFDWPSDPPWADELVVIVTSLKPPTLPDNVNVEAPFASVLFVTMYSKITILPSSKDFPIYHHQNKFQIYYLLLLV